MNNLEHLITTGNFDTFVYDVETLPYYMVCKKYGITYNWEEISFRAALCLWLASKSAVV